ncbi:MAG: FHA domain-containing protein [Candidatus Limimorpha sp.]
MKTITIGRVDCDIIISDSNVSRKHAIISLVNGQYVYNDISKNGTTINGRVYQNEKVVITPGTPIYLANKVPLPWAQILMLLPNSPIKVQGNHHKSNEYETVISQYPVSKEESIGAGWGILSFIFPIIGFILYFVWKDTSNYKAKQAANIAWISIAISFVIGFISGLTM